MGTLLHTFRQLVSDPTTSSYDILECGSDRITYHQFGKVVDRLTQNLHGRFSDKPVVAIVAANCPYTLALIFATWSIGGIVAPLDIRTPQTLLLGMLEKIQPNVVVTSNVDVHICEWVTASGFTLSSFSPQESNIPALVSASDTPSLGRESSFHAAQPTDTALYLFTSSASSIATLKCVPLAHQSIYTNCVSQHHWLRSAFPQETFDHLRVLSWGPWSHVIGISHDIGLFTLLTGGCLVLATIPASYGATSQDSQLAGLDSHARLVRVILEKQADILTVVPWALEGMMGIWKEETNEPRRQEIANTFSKMKAVVTGGALPSESVVGWALDLGINIVRSIGMTEIGGPSFLSRQTRDWKGFLAESVVPDLEISLLDEEGKPNPYDGELCVRSRLIFGGYLRQQVSSVTIDEAGYTTFRTGDLWSLTDNHLTWRGRIDDYIYLTSGEILDPRPIERTLASHTSIKRACLVGNNFLDGSSKHVCAIVELENPLKDSTAEVLKALAEVNRDLAPPLRIAWSCVLVLEDGKSIPMTTKGVVFRKRLRELFAGLLELREAAGAGVSARAADGSKFSPEQVKDMVHDVLHASGISREALRLQPDATFSELGMTSVIAVAIVNKLNRLFDFNLPLETCHIYVDCAQLAAKVASSLDATGPLPKAPLNLTPIASPAEEVVIVGMACRLPGNINTPEEFWSALVDQREDIMSAIPNDRWDHESFYRPTWEKPGDITLQKAGFIKLDEFDNAFFGISAAEAAVTSPFNRLVLETAFDALENAAIPPSSLKGSNTGVFVASGVEDGYSKLLLKAKLYDSNKFSGLGVAPSVACGRLSYLLDVHGPSVTVDTACSGGLVAFDLGVKHLQSGKGETALICATNTHVWPGSFGFTSAQQMTSPDSRCASFSNKADGYVPSEGAVTIILKSRAAAERDGDRVMAIVKSSVVKHDGRSQGLIAPNGAAQVALQCEVLRDAGLQPEEVDFVEAHGTGTALGDQIEAQSINEVFRSSHTSTRPLFVGAAKSCIGHTEGAAGLVGVLKTVLSLRHKAVPGIVHLSEDAINTKIDRVSVPLCFPLNLEPIKPCITETGTHAARALVLSYGFAGTIAGTILQSSSNQDKAHQQQALGHPTADSLSMIFVLSAKSAPALRELLKRYIDYCMIANDAEFCEICYSTCVTRDYHRFRFACCAKNLTDLIKQLQGALSADIAIPSHNPPIVYAFPGQGTQSAGMAGALARRFPDFMAIICDAGAQASRLTGVNISNLLLMSSPDNIAIIDQNHIAQVCIFVYQIAICQWLERLGVFASAVLGHSLGEVAASVVSGALSFDVALRLVVLRGQLMHSNPYRPGAMAAISASQEIVQSLIFRAKGKEDLDIAVYNSTASNTVTGDRSAVERFVTKAKEAGHQATLLNVDQAFHSPLVAGAVEPLNLWLSEKPHLLGKPSVPFLSSAFGDYLPDDESLDAKYWTKQLRNPVKFAPLLHRLSRADKAHVLLDLGPRPIITSIFRNSNLKSQTLIAASLSSGKGDTVEACLSGIAKLFHSGCNLDFKYLYHNEAQAYRKVTLPGYPWQRKRYWPSFLPSRPTHSRTTEYTQNHQNTRAPITSTSWTVSAGLLHTLRDHTINGDAVVPAAALAAFAAGLPTGHIHSHLTSLRFHMPLALHHADVSSEIRIGSNEDGLFALMHEGRKICSGRIQPLPVMHMEPATNIHMTTSPLRILQGAELYSQYRSVHFGKSFQNVKEVSFYDKYVEALIVIEPTNGSPYDFIRQLDPCIHATSAIIPTIMQGGPDLKTGTYLPSSFDDLTFHTAAFPLSVRCRYNQPMKSERGHRVLSTGFQILTLEGRVLATCGRLSVAWVPASIPSVVAGAQPSDSAMSEVPILGYKWDVRPLPTERRLDLSNFDSIVSFAPCSRNSTSLITLRSATPESQLSRYAVSSRFPDTLSLVPIEDINEHPPMPGSFIDEQVVDLKSQLQGKRVLIILDLFSQQSNMDTLESVTQNVLRLCQLVISSKIDIETIVAVTWTSDAVHLASTKIPHILVGSAVQGFLKVFKREMDLKSNQVWSLQVPETWSLEDVEQTLLKELDIRQQGEQQSTIVQYRGSASSEAERLVPTLARMDAASQVPIRSSAPTSGVIVVTGFGSIAQGLIKHWLVSGPFAVVVLGRKAKDDTLVVSTLASLRNDSQQGRVSYIQSDITDYRATYTALQTSIVWYGQVDAIVHTAAVVDDATIPKLTSAQLYRVLNPKVNGAWNLHQASIDLNIDLTKFVMLSSISVPFGNPGQAAYVAGNSFMDALAVHRRHLGFPGHSLQLGPWESRLIANMDFADDLLLPISHKEGVPLIEQAVALDDPVQVIARVQRNHLLHKTWATEDPLFADILNDGKSTDDIGPGSPTSEGTTLVPGGVDVKTTEGSMRSFIAELAGVSENELEFHEPLSRYGIDSIAYAQLRGKVGKAFQVNLPLSFLSDAYDIGDVVMHVNHKMSKGVDGVLYG